MGIFLVQRKFDDPFEPHMVYGLNDDKGFFRGYAPAKDENINRLKAAFPDVVFPEDYLAFLQIHNGSQKQLTQGSSAEENERDL